MGANMIDIVNGGWGYSTLQQSQWKTRVYQSL